MSSIRKSRPGIEVAAGLAYTKSPRHAKAMALTQDIINLGLTLSPDAYIACSFGKDSAVMLHLILQHKPDVSVRFLRWPESNILNNYDEVIDEWQRQYTNLNLSIVDLSRSTLDERVADRWNAIANVAPTTGYFVGLRASESKARRLTLMQHGAVYKLKSTGLWRFSPLGHWRDEDVAGYVFQYDLPMLDAYHQQGLTARTSSRVPRHQVREQALADLRLRDPHRFEQLAAMFPELREWVY